MKELPIKKYIRYLFGVSIFVFILNKLFLRPWILENNLSDFLLVATYSIPNLIEAIIGTLILTGILLQTRQYFKEKFGSIKDTYIYQIAVTITAIYVIYQELKFHNLGGNNVYDPYDLVASIIGLIGTFVIIELLGFTEDVEIDLKTSE
jgi:hypothetical protein